jgi:hypothetical protein
MPASSSVTAPKNDTNVAVISNGPVMRLMRASIVAMPDTGSAGSSAPTAARAARRPPGTLLARVSSWEEARGQRLVDQGNPRTRSVVAGTQQTAVSKAHTHRRRIVGCDFAQGGHRRVGGWQVCLALEGQFDAAAPPTERHQRTCATTRPDRSRVPALPAVARAEALRRSALRSARAPVQAGSDPKTAPQSAPTPRAKSTTVRSTVSRP